MIQLRSRNIFTTDLYKSIASICPGLQTTVTGHRRWEEPLSRASSTGKGPRWRDAGTRAGRGTGPCVPPGQAPDFGDILSFRDRH